MNYLNEQELAQRWRISQRTLQKWRQNNIGPAYVKIGGRIRYRLSDVDEWEHKQLNGGSS